MSEPRPAQVKKRAPNNASRVLAMAAVAMLIVVAIAGIVLADRHPAAPAAVTAAAASGTAPPASAAAVVVNPNEVVFAEGSAKLPVTASDSIARFAESARSSGSAVRITARFLTGENKARDAELSAARVAAVRESLMADGIGAGTIQVVQTEAGSLAKLDADRIVLSLR